MTPAGDTAWVLDGISANNQVEFGGRRFFIIGNIKDVDGGNTIRLSVPVNGIAMFSDNNGPTDRALVNTNAQTVIRRAQLILDEIKVSSATVSPLNFVSIVSFPAFSFTRSGSRSAGRS